MKKKKKKGIEQTRRTKILEKIDYFINNVKGINYLSSSSSYNLLLIKRIIDFIDNEFPRKIKYQKIKTILESMVDDKSYRYPTATNFKSNLISILIDLATTYDLDTSEEFTIILHPKVKEHSLNLFKNGHYAQAVYESVKSLNNYVKNKANITKDDLSKAMALVFNENDPIIKLNELKTRSEIDEQKGFKLLFMGAMTGIRNPIGHETYEFDKNSALEYLAFLSLLFRRAEEGKL